MVKDNNEIILSRKSALLPRQLKQMPFNVKHKLEINFWNLFRKSKSCTFKSRSLNSWFAPHFSQSSCSKSKHSLSILIGCILEKLALIMIPRNKFSRYNLVNFWTISYLSYEVISYLSYEVNWIKSEAKEKIWKYSYYWIHSYLNESKWPIQTS